MRRNVFLTVGGTAGHVYPALTISELLNDQGHNVCFIGHKTQENKHLKSSPMEKIDIPSGANLRGIPALASGFLRAAKTLKQKKPDLIIGFGSYHTAPVLAAATLLRIPFLLHETNSVAGRVNRFFSFYACCSAVQFPSLKKELKGRTELVEMPLKQQMVLKNSSKGEALKYFGLQEGRKTLLAFGGSLGARSLNDKLSQALTRIDASKIQLIHFTGQSSDGDALHRFYKDHGITACVKIFEEKMHLAYLAADLLLARAGSGTIFEQMNFNLPAIYVPFPFATDRHQLLNAQFAKESFGAVILEERELTPSYLADTIDQTLFNEKKLQAMREGIFRFKQEKEPRKSFLSLIEEYL